MGNFNIFGIGPLELFFIIAIALIVLGPERLPQVAREVLKFIAQLRALYQDLTSQLNTEFGDLTELQELRRDLQELNTDRLLSALGDDEEPKNKEKAKATPAKTTPAKSTPSTPKTNTASPTQSATPKSAPASKDEGVKAETPSAQSATAKTDEKSTEVEEPAEPSSSEAQNGAGEPDHDPSQPIAQNPSTSSAQESE